MKPLQKIKKHLFWILPFLASLFLLIPGEVRYWATDNDVMQYIAAAARKLPESSFLVFIAHPVGYLLRGLYLMTDCVNWYALLLIFGICHAFGTMHYVFCDVCEKKTIPLSVYTAVTAFFFGLNVYVLLKLDFSAATFCMILAFCVQFFFSEGKAGRMINMFLLLFFGCAWRYTSPAVVIIMALCLLLRYWGDKKLLLKKGTIFILAFLVVWLPIVFSLQAYRSAKGFDDYFSYRDAWAYVIDRRPVDMDVHGQELEKIKFSENDIQMTWRWFIADRHVFETEKVEAIYDMLSLQEKYELNIPRIFVLMLKTKWNWFVGILFLLCFLCTKGEKKTIVLLALCTFAMVAGQIVRQRVVDRITMPLYFMGICFAILVMTENLNTNVLVGKGKRIWTTFFCGGTTVLFIGTIVLGMRFVSEIKKANEKQAEQIEAFWQYAEDNDNPVLLSGASGGSPVVPIRLWGRLADTPIDFSLGGWTVGHPYVRMLMKDNGLETYTDQVYHALLQPDVYYVVKNVEVVSYIAVFFEEHYGIKTEWKVQDQVAGYNVIKLTAVPQM